jgi:hypothetical protein
VRRLHVGELFVDGFTERHQPARRIERLGMRERRAFSAPAWRMIEPGQST